MDVIITVIGEFIWSSSCGIVNFCLSSGLSALVVFVSFLCGILASAFYKYTISRERMLFNGTNKSATSNYSRRKFSMRSPSILTEIMDSNSNDSINLLSEIEISNDKNTSENEQISNDMIIYTTEDSEEEIQVKQIKNIYHVLNDNDMTVTDFFDQLKMYGVELDDEIELELS